MSGIIRNSEPSLKSELITEGEKFKIDKNQRESEQSQQQSQQENDKEDEEQENEDEQLEEKQSEKDEQEASQQQLSVNQSDSKSEESKSQSKQSKLQDFSGQLLGSKLSIAKTICDEIIKDKKSALQDLQNQIYQGTFYPLEHYEEIMKNLKCHPAAGYNQYDDWFRLKGSSNHKLHSLKVRNWSRAQFLCYFQATYKLADGTIVQGNEVYCPEGAKQEAKNEGTEMEQTFTLQDDEYAIEIIGRTGAWTDKVGIVTNKGKRWEHGGDGGGEVRRVAPKGFHFATFGANNGGDCKIHCIYADILILPEAKKASQYKLPLSEMRSVIKLIFDFLQFNDIVKLFLLCKEFAAYRYDEYVITKIAEKIIYQCEVQSRQYLNLLINNSDLTSNLNKHLVKIKNLLELTENKIRNPDGEDQFNGFTEVVKGGSGIQTTSNAPNYHKCAFLTSFSYGILGWKKQLSEVFSPEFVQDFLAGKAAIIAGCYMKANVFGSVGFIELKFYENDKLVSKDNLNMDQLKNIYTKYSLKYIHDVYSSFKPTTIEFRVAGKDVKYWAGFYGAYISSIFCHGLVMHTQEQKDFIYRQ